MKRKGGRSVRDHSGFTRIGWGYVVILVLALLAAWNTGTNLLYIVVGGLSSFVVLSYLLSFFLLRHVTMTRVAPKAAYRGQPFQIHVQIENRRRWFASLFLRIEKSNRKAGSAGFIACLPAGTAARLSVEGCFDKRGEHQLEEFWLVCAFPFGLIERRRKIVDDIRVLVYPRVHIVRANALQRLPSAARMSTQPSDDGDEYYGLREYVPGDDIRRIAWRISARLGKWIVRELAQYQSRLVVLALDTSYNPNVKDFNERFEDSIELTASVAMMLLRRRNEVSIVTQEGFLEGGDGKGHERRVLEMLARVSVSTSTESFSQTVSAMESANSALMLISPDPESWGRVTEHGNILDPRELVHG